MAKLSPPPVLTKWRSWKISLPRHDMQLEIIAQDPRPAMGRVVGGGDASPCQIGFTRYPSMSPHVASYNDFTVPLTASVLQEILVVNEGLHNCGTFGQQALAALAGHLMKRDIRYSAETGSGSSTLLFSHCSDLHTVFSVDSGGGSVVNVKASPLLQANHVLWVEGPTQLMLPTYRFQNKLQAVLIDGPHGYPFPDLEYYYLYQHLETGALLVIDDIQIPTIHNLFEFLRKDAMFVLDEVVDTTAFFTRTDTPAFCPIGDGWWEQEYNKTPLAQV